jgi:class 3 adenylate cyclase
MTERLRETPEKIVETLNNYLELTSKSVFNNGGSVDKFIGDATMALFNGFVPLEDYIYKAVKAAWDMVQGAGAVNELIREKHGIDIGFGVGVHCGEAIVGNLGPSFRKDYTAIGDTVNTAARLESNAKRSQVLISRDVYDLLGDRIKAESIGEIPLKGKSVPLEVFALAGVT